MRVAVDVGERLVSLRVQVAGIRLGIQLGRLPAAGPRLEIQAGLAVPLQAVEQMMRARRRLRHRLAERIHHRDAFRREEHRLARLAVIVSLQHRARVVRQREGRAGLVRVDPACFARGRDARVAAHFVHVRPHGEDARHAIHAFFENAVVVTVRIEHEIGCDRQCGRVRESGLGNAPAQRVVSETRHRHQRGADVALHQHQTIREVVTELRCAGWRVDGDKVAIEIMLLGAEGRDRVLVHLEIRRLRRAGIHRVNPHHAVRGNGLAVALLVERQALRADGAGAAAFERSHPV